jgi:hypothetical protein
LIQLLNLSFPYTGAAASILSSAAISTSPSPVHPFKVRREQTLVGK